MKKNLLLFIFTIFLSLTLIEIILLISGKYKNLTKNKLIPSDAIYERPHSSQQNHKHPDLDYIISNYFDQDGVKNFDKTPTSKKKNIIGIFGDSFTENIAVDKKFEYSRIVNTKLYNHTLVNYGVGGYSADQSFIRYLKYKNHNIDHVFLFLFPGDEWFNTKSEFFDNGDYKIYKTKLNIYYQIIGKLNLTYFAIDSFYLIRDLFKKNHITIDINNYNSVLANKINKKFYNKDNPSCQEQPDICEKNLLNLLIAFQKEVKNNNAKFHILIYPEVKFVSYLTNIIKKTDKNISYYILNKDLGKSRNRVNDSLKKRQLVFMNDSHWNEYGNLVFAKNLINIFNKTGISLNNSELKINISDIDLFYKDN